MRSAFFKLSILVLTAVAAWSQPPGQMVNPHTQIRWPLNCTSTGDVYNYQNNTCIDMNSINPATQLNWPGGCNTASMVYAPQSNGCYDINAINPASQLNWPANCIGANMVYVPTSNTCIANGTAANPAPNPMEVQINNNGVFGGAHNVLYDGSGGLTAKQFGALRFAGPWQTGSGNNGINNAQAPNQTVYAEPSYATTELPNWNSFFTASPFHFVDTRNSQNVNFYHNPSPVLMGGPFPYSTGNTTGAGHYCLIDGTGKNGTDCFQVGYTLNAPGYSYGNPGGITTQGWAGGGSFNVGMVARSKGITGAVGDHLQKFAVGDMSNYFYCYGSGGTTAASDEGQTCLATQSVENNTQFNALCNGAGCTAGSTLIKTNGTNGGFHGVGQYVYDLSKQSSNYTGHMLTVTAPNGAPSVITVDATVPASTAWGNIQTTLNTPNNPTPPFTTSMTFNVTITGGTSGTSSAFVVSTPPSGSTPWQNLACFSGSYHDQVQVTAVGTPSGSVQSITVAARMPHLTGTAIYQGGMCGMGFEATDYTFTYGNATPTALNNASGFRYLFDVIGSTDTHTLIVQAFSTSGINPVPPLVAHNVDYFNVTNAFSCSGTACTGVAVSGSGSLFQPSINMNGTTTWLSGSDVPALNAPCTSMTWTSTTNFTCTIAGLSGTTGPGTLQIKATRGSTVFQTWPIAETIDVQNEALTPPQVDGTLALEPNIIPIASGDTIIQTHHYSNTHVGIKATQIQQNPLSAFVNGLLVKVSGAGVGPMGTFQNLNPNSFYTEYGGTLVPAAAVTFSGAYAQGLVFTQGPQNGTSLLYVPSNTTQNNNVMYSYNIWNDNTNNTLINYIPHTKQVSYTTSGPEVHTANGGITLTTRSSATGAGLTVVAPSTPAASISGIDVGAYPLTSGGTGTTTLPGFYLHGSFNGNNGPGVSTWSTAGTYLGINTYFSFAGNLIDAHANGGPSLFSVDYTGKVTAAGSPVPVLNSVAASANVGLATLSAGTITVTTTSACTPAATCIYSLTNCGVAGTQGMLSVGTVTAGTNFIINSSNAADTSKVCWRIN